MFSLKSFLQTIQSAILAADDVLKDKNQELLNNYFEKDIDDQEIQKRINQTLSATETILDSGDGNTISKQALDNVKLSLKDLKTSLTQPDTIEQALAEEDLRPKTVLLNYPSVNKDGKVVNKEVHVPLITLIPITFSKIEELRLRTNLEMNVVDGEIQIGLGKFSKGSTSDQEKDLPEKTGKNSVGSIEIVMKPQPMSDGMQQVVDAYEQILKAQLPH